MGVGITVMYIIELNDDIKKGRSWVGHSNSRDTSGFYYTRENNCAAFTKDLNEMPKLQAFLESRGCTYNIVEITEKGHRRIYHGY